MLPEWKEQAASSEGAFQTGKKVIIRKNMNISESYCISTHFLINISQLEKL